MGWSRRMAALRSAAPTMTPNQRPRVSQPSMRTSTSGAHRGSAVAQQSGSRHTGTSGALARRTGPGLTQTAPPEARLMLADRVLAGVAVGPLIGPGAPVPGRIRPCPALDYEIVGGRLVYFGPF